MSLSQSIRGALQVRAATAAIFPAADQIAYEDLPFSSTTGVPYARLTVIPASDRPFSVSAGTKVHRGIFQIDVCYPSGKGTATIEQAADSVRDVFPAALRLPVDDGYIAVDYSERSSRMPVDAGFAMISISVGWHVFSREN